MFHFIAADLRRHWIGALAIAADHRARHRARRGGDACRRRALRIGSARAAGPFDLVIGAPGSETQLVLSSMFLQAAPLSLMPGSVLAALAEDPRPQLGRADRLRRLHRRTARSSAPPSR